MCIFCIKRIYSYFAPVSFGNKKCSYYLFFVYNLIPPLHNWLQLASLAFWIWFLYKNGSSIFQREFLFSSNVGILIVLPYIQCYIACSVCFDRFSTLERKVGFLLAILEERRIWTLVNLDLCTLFANDFQLIPWDWCIPSLVHAFHVFQQFPYFCKV